jgi:hypothetical protein
MEVIVTEIPNIQYTKTYVKPKKVIKNSIVFILSSFIESGDNLFMDKDDLYDFLEWNFIKENEFYDYLKKFNIKYEICEEFNIINGISIKKNTDVFM